MRSFFGLLFVFVVLHVLVIAWSCGVALALNWLIPAIDFSAAVIVGAVSTIGVLYIFIDAVRSLPYVEVHDDLDDEADVDGSEVVNVSEREWTPRKKTRKARAKRK